MKKVLYVFLLVCATSVMFTSCRDEKTTGEKVEDAIDNVGDGIEDAADDVGDGIEDAGDDLEDVLD